MIEAILNRLRGTGDVVKGITGTMLYAVYLLIIVGLLVGMCNTEVNSMIVWLTPVDGYDLVLTNIFYVVSTVVLFLAGESYAFGKWVGFLVDYEDEHTPEYDSKVGKRFPYVHYVANWIVSEKVDYMLYCQVALAIRGFVWWAPVYMMMAVAGLISYWIALVIGVVLGIGFPVACKVGREWEYDAKFGPIRFKRGWENQEIVYGFIQGLCLWFVIFYNIL